MFDIVTQKRLVDFLIAGAQKAGTTALHRFLHHHENLFFPVSKELHFFDGGRKSDWSIPDYSHYEKFFLRKKPDQIAGEATPIYTYWPSCMERIGSYNLDMRLIMCIRHPAERAFSHWSMECGRNKENMAFSDAIRHGRLRVTSDADSHFGHHRVFSYVERGYYARQISNVLKHFPKEQLLVVAHDTMREDLHGFLDAICRFLCVPVFSSYPRNQNILPVKPTPNAGELSNRDRDYLLSLYEDDIKITQDLTGLDLSAWLT